jgi:hypothetical protein
MHSPWTSSNSPTKKADEILSALGKEMEEFTKAWLKLAKLKNASRMSDLYSYQLPEDRIAISPQ